jgi:hypothetical protein
MVDSQQVSKHEPSEYKADVTVVTPMFGRISSLVPKSNRFSSSLPTLQILFFLKSERNLYIGEQFATFFC